MKKSILSFLLLLVASFAMGQFPKKTYSGDSATMQVVGKVTSVDSITGGVRAKIINGGIYTDTTAANVALFLSYYNGAQIMTTSGGVKFWLRYAGAWNQVSGGGGGSSYTSGTNIYFAKLVKN